LKVSENPHKAAQQQSIERRKNY